MTVRDITIKYITDLTFCPTRLNDTTAVPASIFAAVSTLSTVSNSSTVPIPFVLIEYFKWYYYELMIYERFELMIYERFEYYQHNSK